MIEHAAILELGELGAHRRRRCLDQPGLHERLRPDRLARSSMCASTTSRSRSSCRGESGRLRVVAHSVISLEMTSLATMRPRRVRVRVPALDDRHPERGEPVCLRQVEAVAHGRDVDRLVQAQPEQDPLVEALLRRELLVEAQRRLAASQHLDVRREPRAVPSAKEPERRDRADADPEVVLPLPDREVVPAATVVAAEVRGLVPAVARGLEPLDDVLVVVLEQLGLALELGAVGEGEARPRLRLELVAGEVVGLERERLVDVAVERGTRLARDPEEHVEVQVGDARPTERGDGSADGLRRGAALEHRELARAEALGAERDASAVPHQDARERVVDGLGVGLHGELGCRRQSVEQAIEQRRARAAWACRRR